jgi:hypothetical protein
MAESLSETPYTAGKSQVRFGRKARNNIEKKTNKPNSFDPAIFNATLTQSNAGVDYSNGTSVGLVMKERLDWTGRTVRS